MYFVYTYCTNSGTQVLLDVRKERAGSGQEYVSGNILIDTLFPENVGWTDTWCIEYGTFLSSEQFEHWKGEHIELFL
jgi:hypothetical protein